MVFVWKKKVTFANNVEGEEPKAKTKGRKKASSDGDPLEDRGSKDKKKKKSKKSQLFTERRDVEPINVPLKSSARSSAVGSFIVDRE